MQDAMSIRLRSMRGYNMSIMAKALPMHYARKHIKSCIYQRFGGSNNQYV